MHCCDERCRFSKGKGEVYTCLASGHVHICDATCSLRCNNCDATLVCPISGRCFGQTINHNPFRNIKRTRFTDLSLAPKLCTKRIRTVSRLKKPKKHEPFDSSKVHDFLQHLLCSKHLIKYDRDQWQHWVDGIRRLWDFACTRPSKTLCTLTEFSLGVLYLLPVGLSINKVTIIASHELLRGKLPPVTHLVKYGVAKKGIRLGKNVLLGSMRHCELEAIPRVGLYQPP